MVEEQAIRVELDAAKIAGKTLFQILCAVGRQILSPGIKFGHQNIKALNRQGRSLSSYEVSGDQAKMKKVKAALKQYSVDFALEKDKETGKVYAWFKGQDVERIEAALKNLIVGQGKESPQKKPSLRDICAAARQKAATMNAERKAQYQERGERV